METNPANPDSESKPVQTIWWSRLLNAFAAFTLFYIGMGFGRMAM